LEFLYRMNPDTPRGADIAPVVPPRRRFGVLWLISSLHLWAYAVKTAVSNADF